MTDRYDGAVGPLFIITVASVSSSSDSKTLLLLPVAAAATVATKGAEKPL